MAGPAADRSWEPAVPASPQRRRGVLLLLVVLGVGGAAVATPSALGAPDRRGTAAPRVDAAALEAARKFLCPFGGTPVRGRRGRCRGGAPTAVAGSGGGGAMSGWDTGLPAPGRRQAPCPPGTAATTAIARPESVRCVPE
jgi:hypothetical protein